jgi:hypothetical protein
VVLTSRQTNWTNAFGELDGFSELQESYVVVVRLLVEIPVSDYGGYRPHLGGGVFSGGLVVVSQNDADFRALQPKVTN